MTGTFHLNRLMEGCTTVYGVTETCHFNLLGVVSRQVGKHDVDGQIVRSFQLALSDHHSPSQTPIPCLEKRHNLAHKDWLVIN
jgi:hypothetical protein